MSVHILGIRHHGPGSARSVVTALEAIRPQVVLVEGPPDADDLLALAARMEMRPPVALLVYRPDEPKRAVFYPFAAFSPEWQAIRWALKNAVPVRFMDLPQRHRLAEEREEDDTERVHGDPFAMIAEAAGYSDGERWWEDQFEKRHAGPEVFEAVLELMTALREGTPTNAAEGRREAWMRQTLREAQKQGHERIAVVCGAWHAPALATMPTAKADAETLRGLPKCAVAATWLPWTHRRLTYASGYGAGIQSPGYYEHLWALVQPVELATRWMTRVAHLLRAEDLESSTASIIEATRLAETAAVLRGFTVPGLAEFNEAAQAVFCFGDSAPMQLIAERLIVGDVLGAVPDEAPQVPLQRDFQKETKRLRLPPEALDRTLELDLRKPNDLDRSRLLHRLRLLKVEWGKPMSARGKGTFRETWHLCWEPELEVALIETAPWGNTIAEAATRFTIERGSHCSALPELTALVEVLLLAELPEAVDRVMHQLENQAALTSDIGHLMDALPPLAAVLRYGNVRQSDASMVGHIVNGLVARICAGLPPACAALNDDAAAEMLMRLNATHSALANLADETLRAGWNSTLLQLADNDTLHGLLVGRCTRLLLDEAKIDADTAATRLSRHLSRANAPAQSAAWIEGFLAGSGLVLLHQARLWNLLDDWLGSLTADHFTEVLPLLRRTFSTFAPPERRQMGELARRGTGTSTTVTVPMDEDIEQERADRLLPTFALLLGATP
ncbi:MAG: hypothetical protein JWL90_2454 [Chthoniobacteraceae bacterium]|nr:hypothetical protein [Chthoniobacteraceae bacterium]